MANGCAKTSTLLMGLGESQIPDAKMTLLVLEAAALRSKSLRSTRSVLEHVRGIIRFYLDTRDETAVTLTGETSLALLRDFLESLADRCRTAPGAARQALTVWAEALGIDWPLTNPLVISAATVTSNDAPKQAPSIPLSTVKLIEQVALNVEVASRKLAYASAILLMSYASLRFSDAQRIRTIEMNEDSAHGALLDSKTKKAHGQNWAWACPKTGITSSTERTQPLLDLRQAYRSVNSHDMSFCFPRIDYNWQLVDAGAAAYSTARRKLALLCVGMGDPNGETYTMHSPKNLFHTAANQMSFDQRELAAIGHWATNSKMPERYDRSVCASELLLRNTIIKQMAAGWEVSDSPHLPTTVTGRVRIGEEPPPVMEADTQPSEVVASRDAAAAVTLDTTETPPAVVGPRDAIAVLTLGTNENPPAKPETQGTQLVEETGTPACHGSEHEST